MILLFPSELLKLRRQPGVLFWGFITVPAASLLFKLLLNAAFYVRSGNLSFNEKGVLLAAAESLSIVSNPFCQLLYAMGVSSIVFIEYRYSGLRSLVPRAGRISIISAKLLISLYCICLSLGLMAMSNMILSAAMIGVSGGQWAAADVEVRGIFQLASAFVISFLELGTLSAIAVALTIVFRNVLGAVIPIFTVGVCVNLAQSYLSLSAVQLPLPSVAAETARSAIVSGSGPDQGLLAVGILAIWFLFSTSTAIAIFSRQQFPEE